MPWRVDCNPVVLVYLSTLTSNVSSNRIEKLLSKHPYFVNILISLLFNFLYFPHCCVIVCNIITCFFLSVPVLFFDSIIIFYFLLVLCPNREILLNTPYDALTNRPSYVCVFPCLVNQTNDVSFNVFFQRNHNAHTSRVTSILSSVNGKWESSWKRLISAWEWLRCTRKRIWCSLCAGDK